jgi:transcriptional regulator with XRE-family HTH domain
MAAKAELPIRSFPVADWPEIGDRAERCRVASGISAAAAAERLGVAEADLLAFERGTGALGAYEIRELASLLDTTPGAWFYADEDALFRGRDSRSVGEARAIGISLMAEFLAAEALIG